MSSRFSSSSPSSPLGLSRTAVIAGGVILFHAAALWALQSGLLRKAAEVVVPVELLAQIIEPPRPAPPPPPPPPPPPAPPKKEIVKPPPRPQAVRETRPTPPPPNAPTGAVEPPPPAPPAPETPPAPPAPPAPPPAPPAAPAQKELTGAQAQWLVKPPLVFPAMSKRLGESGTVVVRIIFDSEGNAKRATVVTSSGYERLDAAGRDAALRSRIAINLPAGTPRSPEYAYTAPLAFVLN